MALIAGEARLLCLVDQFEDMATQITIGILNLQPGFVLGGQVI